LGAATEHPPKDVRADRLSSFYERPIDLDCRWAHYNNEQRREHTEHEWEKHFDWCFLCHLLDMLPLRRTGLLGLGTQQRAYGDAEGFRLYQRHEQGAQLVDIGTTVYRL
jgi:hypothetical protein